MSFHWLILIFLFLVRDVAVTIRTITLVSNNQNQLPEVLYKKGVLLNFAKFTGKHPFQGLFFNKVAGLRPATLLKKRLWHRCFSVNFAKFLRIPFATEHLQWPLSLFLNLTKVVFEAINLSCAQ